MEFYKINSSVEVINYISSLLKARLEAGDRVLWLLSGGSAIELEVAVARDLNGLDQNLSVSLIDERYGSVNHPDSNWQQLLDKGFSLPNARLQPVLSGQDMAATAQDYRHFLQRALDECEFSLGVAGIGADGHTLGLKPGSPALNEKSLVSAYDWDDFKRLSGTAELIKRLDEIVVYAVGSEKKIQLQKLRKALPASEQPAQLLKLCPKVRIFTDQEA